MNFTILFYPQHWQNVCSFTFHTYISSLMNVINLFFYFFSQGKGKGKGRFTWEPRITAPSWRKSVKLLVRLKLPVNHLPRGTFNWDPPGCGCCCMYSTAFRNASVLDVVPSPTPPKSVIDITTFLLGASPEQLHGSTEPVPGRNQTEPAHLGNPDIVEIW